MCYIQSEDTLKIIDARSYKQATVVLFCKLGLKSKALQWIKLHIYWADKSKMIQHPTINRKHKKVAENREALANLNDRTNMRTGTLGASRGSSHLFSFRVLYFKIISTSLPPAHQHICISYCESLAATDSVLILLWNISVWIKCVFSPCWVLAQHTASGRLTLISPNNTAIDSYAEWSILVKHSED